MRKISIRFLVGFATVASAGAAMAQGTMDASALTNTLSSSQLNSVISNSSGAKLNQQSGQSNEFAMAASGSSAASMASALKEANSQLPVANVVIGSGSGKPAASKASDNPFAQAASSSSMSMSNALASAPAATGEDATAVAFIGAGMSNFSNAISDQATATNQRLGK